MKLPDPLLVVARHLGDLRDRVVFVGGMIRSLSSAGTSEISRRAAGSACGPRTWR